MNEKVFLVGNDINNILSEEYSWERLLTDLVKHAKIKTEISSDNKPFPWAQTKLSLRQPF
jgi:hypothetical protein